MEKKGNHEILAKRKQQPGNSILMDCYRRG